MTNLGNKISGALYGVAVGDALGAPLEFMSAAEITRKYGSAVKDMIGGGWLNVEPGEVTDDTQMTIAVALAIAMHPEEPEPYAGQYFAEWAMGGPKRNHKCAPDDDTAPGTERLQRSGTV